MRYTVKWYVSPLDEKPEIQTFEQWFEVEEYFDQMSDNEVFQECMESGLVSLSDEQNGEHL